MKPNFALSLSFEGIRLLHRAAGGWRVVGDVALDAPDMAGELAMLRRTATALEPGGLFSKVLLPNAQIKYLTIDTPDMDEAARRAAARTALDGATPYAVDDLAFDISADGARTHVAAVARETLIEAEGFAAEHQFNPVSFAAIPGEIPYLGEPFFGPSLAGSAQLPEGEEIEPDGIAVVVIGDVAAGDGPVVAVPDEAPADALAEPEPAEAAPGSPTDQPPAIEDSTEATEDAPAMPVFKSRAAPEDPSKTPAGAAQAPDAPVPAPPPPPIKPAAAPALGPAAKPAAPVKAPVVPAPDVTGFASRRGPASGPTPGPVAAPAPQVAAPSVPQDPAIAAAAAETPDAAAATAPQIAPAASRSKAAAPIAAASAAAAATGRFLSRRRNRAAAPAMAGAAALPTTAVAPPPTPRTEAERMTIFGARKADVGGKPKFLGLILTAALLVFLAGVAAWASVFLDDGLNLSRLFGERAPREVVSAPAEPKESAPDDTAVVTASLSTGLTAEDTAVLDALREPTPAPETALSDQQVQEIYATTGIWPRAPEVPPEPSGLVNIDDLYLTSVDPVTSATDAIALPAVSGFATDLAMGTLAAPAAAGTTFALDARGLVVPTATGALTPDGFTVFLGRPPLEPPATLTRFQAPPQDDAASQALAAFRPKLKPKDLVEKTERAQLNGLTRAELAGQRPKLRPRSLQQIAQAKAAEEAKAKQVAEDKAKAEAEEAAAAEVAAAKPAEPKAFENATKLAIRASVRPDTRPRNFERIVRRAQRTPAPQAETRVASTAQVAPRVVKPKIPSKTSVARQATVKNAINLRKVNLIGVYGKPSNRRALVRLSNGRYKKVTVGDRIDGGRVNAIGNSELRYTKGGRNVVLKMPRG